MPLTVLSISLFPGVFDRTRCVFARVGVFRWFDSVHGYTVNYLRYGDHGPGTFACGALAVRVERG